jgi:hypothetical protein
MEAPKRLKHPYLITRDTSPSRANLEVFSFSPSDGCPTTATCLASTQALRSRRVSSASKLLGASDQGGQTAPWAVRPARRLDHPSWAVRLVWVAAPPRRVFGLGFVAQLSNPVVFWRTTATPRTWCSLCQSPLMTRLPRSPDSTLVLRLYQETVHDFVLLFLPPCGPHLTPLATGSLEPSLLVFSTPGGLTSDDLSRLFFTRTNTSQAATCTCNT